MRIWVHGVLVVVCCACLLWPDPLVAQQPSSAQESSSATGDQKEAKKQARKFAKEAGPAYASWLRDEVPDIITEEERRAFAGLGTNEEREQFIESFWRRRNPDPESPENAFKEEHYRRLAYADEHFSSGIAGRETDRGHIYILWGPPDEIESHPTGGVWNRPPEQGGGSTPTYPWELWRYRHLESVGENVEIEFVDPTGSGEYHVTNDPCEKDAGAHVPGVGASLSEMMGQATKAQRFSNSSGTTCPMPLGGISATAHEFDDLDRFFRVQRAPQHSKDLEEKVSSRMVGNQLRFQYRADFLRATSGTDLVPITVQLRNGDLSYRSKQGVQSAALEVYGRITSVGGRVVQTFEDVISRNIPDSLFEVSRDQFSIYQKSIPLRAGLYRIDIVIKDTQNGNVGVLGEALRVPRFDEDQLDASSLILADQIEPVASKQIGSGQFVVGSYKVRPHLSHDFVAAEKLGIYLQLYNLKIDQATHKTNVSVVYRITKEQQEVWHAVETPEHLHQGGEQLTVERFIPVSFLPPGPYMLELTAIDLSSNQTVVRTSNFTVLPGASKAAPSIPVW